MSALIESLVACLFRDRVYPCADVSPLLCRSERLAAISWILVFLRIAFSHSFTEAINATETQWSRKGRQDGTKAEKYRHQLLNELGPRTTNFELEFVFQHAANF